MKKQGGGLILNMASAAGFFPMSFAPIYSATKGLWPVNATFLVAISFLSHCSVEGQFLLFTSRGCPEPPLLARRLALTGPGGHFLCMQVTSEIFQFQTHGWFK
jgi:hypothetical protein